MSDVIRRRADGSWGQGDPEPTHTSNSSTQEWLKEIGAESPDAKLKNRIAELEREVQEYKEENVKLLRQCMALYRAVKKANCELDKIEEKCEANVWFQKLKERTY